MPRLQLFEFLDLPWFPGFLRKAETDYLEFCLIKFDLFSPSIPKIDQLLNKTNCTQVWDLGSGSGGPWLKLFPKLKETKSELKLKFTDLYPNKSAWEQLSNDMGRDVSFVAEPVDASSVKAPPKTICTMFLAFHHFEQSQARKIIQNAIDHKTPVGIFEAQQRTPRYFITAPMIFIMVLILMPFVKNFSLSRMIFTYLIPILPLCILWDGVVSALRTYSKEELTQLIEQCKGWDHFSWDIELVAKGSVENMVFMGWPKSSPEEDAKDS